MVMAEPDPPRRISVRQALGGGAVADLLLWKKWRGGIVLLVFSTTLWFLFERAGYNLLSFVSNVMLLLVVILFLWAKSASILNRPLPPIPNMEISEKSVVQAADAMRVWVNSGLSIAREISVGRNVKVLLQVALVLWVVSCIGGLCNFLTMVYIGILLSLSVPLLYEKYQDPINEKLSIAKRVVIIQFRKLDGSLLKKIPMPQNKENKTE